MGYDPVFLSPLPRLIVNFTGRGRFLIIKYINIRELFFVQPFNREGPPPPRERGKKKGERKKNVK